MAKLKTNPADYFRKSSKQNQSISEIGSPTLVTTTSKQARELLRITSSPVITSPSSPSYSSTTSTPVTPHSATSTMSFFEHYPKNVASILTNSTSSPIPPTSGNGGKIARNSWLDKEFAKQDAIRSGFLDEEHYSTKYISSGLGKKARDSMHGSKS
ncbi:MAG: hypothetical protein RLZZ210_1289 [Pseudomonadota bacterium]|jgi:hypothetical protein